MWISFSPPALLTDPASPSPAHAAVSLLWAPRASLRLAECLHLPSVTEKEASSPEGCARSPRAISGRLGGCLLRRLRNQGSSSSGGFTRGVGYLSASRLFRESPSTNPFRADVRRGLERSHPAGWADACPPCPPAPLPRRGQTASLQVGSWLVCSSQNTRVPAASKPVD